MSDRFFAMQFREAVPSEADALRRIERDVTAADASRPPERRFELKLFKESQLVVVAENQKMLVFGEHASLFLTLKNNTVAVFDGSTGLSYGSLEEAQAQVEEFGAIGAGGQWTVFKA